MQEADFDAAFAVPPTSRGLIKLLQRSVDVRASPPG
jgi:hypothetical protein